MATLQMKIDRVHAEFVSGNAVSSTVTTHSVVARDGNGNVHANKFKSANMELAHVATERSNDTVFYSSVDDVIRKNTAAGMRGSLGLNNVNNTGATVTATADKIVLRDSEGDIFAAGVGIGTTSPDLELHVHDANNANSGIVLSSTTGYHRLYEASGQLYIQSGAAASADSRADINFTSMYASTTYMKILGSNGNVGIGTTSPNKLLEISGASGLDNSTPVHFRITNTQEATNGSPFTDITKPAALISYYTPDTSTAGKGDVAGIGFRPESTIGGDTALCFYTDGDNADDNALQERMCITHEGKVGIGVTSPGYKLHVNGSIYGSGVTTPYLTGHGYIAERSYTFNPTSNTTKYFLGWTDQDSMQISIRDSGWGHGGTLYATVYFQWGNTPSIVIHKQSGDYTFYYTYKNDRMYLWFNNSGNSNNNNIIHSIRMRTTVGAISTTEPGSTETYASTTIGSSAATEFTTIRLCSTKDGNVGIGDTTPSYKLDVNGDINVASGKKFRMNGTALANSAMITADDANTASRIVQRDSSGNFSAGTITATLSGTATSATDADTVDNLHANQFLRSDTSDTCTGTLYVSGGSYNLANDVGLRVWRAHYQWYGFEFGDDEDLSYYVSIWGHHGVRSSQFVATSDERVKTDIQTLDPEIALLKLEKIRPVSYKMKETGQFVFGFIGQEIEKELPNVVNKSDGILIDFNIMGEFSNKQSIKYQFEHEEKDVFMYTLTLEEPIPSTFDVDKVVAISASSATGNTSVFLYDPEYCGKPEIGGTVMKLLHETELIEEGRYKIIGTETNDFRSLDYNEIFTVTTAALKEVNEQLKAEKIKMATLETKYEELLKRVEDIEAL